MAIIEDMMLNGSALADGASGLLAGLSGFAAQAAAALGGARAVESLFVVSFTAGLLACLYEIRKISG